MKLNEIQSYDKWSNTDRALKEINHTGIYSKLIKLEPIINGARYSLKRRHGYRQHAADDLLFEYVKNPGHFLFNLHDDPKSLNSFDRKKKIPTDMEHRTAHFVFVGIQCDGYNTHTEKFESIILDCNATLGFFHVDTGISDALHQKRAFKLDVYKFPSLLAAYQAALTRMYDYLIQTYPS